jgi:hypothetical protein
VPVTHSGDDAIDSSRLKEFVALDKMALDGLGQGELAIVTSTMLSNVEEFRARVEEISLLLQAATEASQVASLTEELYKTALRMELEGRFILALQQGLCWVTPRRADFGGAPVPKGFRAKTYSGTILRGGVPVDVVVAIDVRNDDMIKALTAEQWQSTLRMYQVEADAFNALPRPERSRRLAESEAAREALKAARSMKGDPARPSQQSGDRGKILPYFLRRTVDDMVTVRVRRQ